MQQQQKAPHFRLIRRRFDPLWRALGFKGLESFNGFRSSSSTSLLGLWFCFFALGGIAGALAGKASDRGIASASYQSYCFVTLANLRRDVHGGAETRGLPRDVLKKLPSRVILKDTKAARGCCCTICLQDVEEGEIARTLPLCQHTFHLACVDKWLSRHGSCPLCRRDL